MCISSVTCSDQLIGCVSIYGDCYIHHTSPKSIFFLGSYSKKISSNVVQIFENSSIRQLVLGSYSVMGVSDLGQVWVCGQPYYLGLGKHDEKDKSLVSPSIIPSLAGKYVKYLVCNARHALAITSKIDIMYIFFLISFFLNSFQRYP